MLNTARSGFTAKHFNALLERVEYVPSFRNFRQTSETWYEVDREDSFVYCAMLGLNIKATIWDGPEQVVIFFKKELGGMIQMTEVLVVLTFVQGFFWAGVYGLGYESITGLVRSFF